MKKQPLCTRRQFLKTGGTIAAAVLAPSIIPASVRGAPAPRIEKAADLKED